MTRRSPARIAQLAALTLLWACGNDSGDGGTGTGPVTVATVEVTAPSTSLTSVGATVQLQAVAKDASGNTVGGKSFTWQSSDAEVASVSDAGLVTAESNGSVSIRATTDGVTGSVQVTVAQVVASVEVTSDADTLRALRDTTRLAAEGKDSRGNTVTGSTFTWSSSDTTVATVDTTGLVEAVSNGRVTVGATVDSITGTAEITVAQALLSVEVTPGVDTLTAIGLTTQFSARALDSRDNVLPDATFTWTSSDSTVALPDSTGLTTAVSNGTATISAASEGGTGSATLLVEQIAAQLATVSGDNQQVAGGATLPDALVVKVTDSNDNGLSGVAIMWEVTQGGGAINAERDTTDAEGLARATWTLGLARDNGVAVTATGLPAATLVATGLSPCVAPSAPPSPSAANPALPSYTVKTVSSLLWPHDGVRAKAIDLLGDGLPDVLIVASKVNGEEAVDNSGGSVFLLRNTGSGDFERDSLDISFGSINQPGISVIFDADGDGLDDAYSPQFGWDGPSGLPPPDGLGARDLMLMQRSGQLVDEATTRFSPHDVRATNIFVSAAGDVDCDGNVDLYSGAAGPGPPHLLINQGAGFFIAEDERMPPNVAGVGGSNFQSAQFCDVDRDGAPDLMLGAAGEAPDLLVMNNGFGRFAPATDGAIPSVPFGPSISREHLLCEDFDNDGWPDIVFAEFSGPTAAVLQMSLWVNNQDGTFQDRSATQFSAAASVRQVSRLTVADLNADGWLDIIAACDVLMNGGGTFVHFTLDDQLPLDPVSGQPICGDSPSDVWLLGNLEPLVTSATGKVDLFLVGALDIPFLLVQN